MAQIIKTFLLLASGLLVGAAPNAQTLPPDFLKALALAQVPEQAVSIWIAPADETANESALPRLQHRADEPMNPASVAKLVTTYAALDLLGAGFVWRTPVWLSGQVHNGILQGDLVIQGQGDPKLVLERLWLLLRRVQGMGVQRIAGDIVLDRHAFDVAAQDPADFDGEPLRPYNAAPDALLLNFKSFALSFTPLASGTAAAVQLDPPLAGVEYPSQIPLSTNAACGDYRSALRADFSDPNRLQLAGHYPTSCGEKVWPVAYADPTSYNARAITGLWRGMGGQLDGSVVDGQAPHTPPSFVVTSPPLADVIRDINKYSNNVMAKQLFLTLGLPAPGSDDPAIPGKASVPSARAALQQWWQMRFPEVGTPVLDNGAGLSRDTRLSARQLGQLLHSAYASPNMPVLMASLPQLGVDGTLKRSQLAQGSAFLKTGSLRNVKALAGYVQGASTKRYVFVALINHANARASGAALDALINWTVMDNLAQ